MMIWLIRTARRSFDLRRTRLIEGLESIGTTFDDEVSTIADHVERPMLILLPG